MSETLTICWTLGLIGPLGWPELLVLAALGVLIFGKRLPEVGKSIGRGIVEFKKGLSGIDEDASVQPPRLEGDRTSEQNVSRESHEQTASPASERPHS